MKVADSGLNRGQIAVHNGFLVQIELIEWTEWWSLACLPRAGSRHCKTSVAARLFYSDVLRYVAPKWHARGGEVRATNNLGV